MTEEERREASRAFVHTLELPVRLSNCLYHDRVTCWLDVIQHGRTWWLRQPNFGPVSLAQLDAAMAQHGQAWAKPMSTLAHAASVLRRAGWTVEPPPARGDFW